MKAVLFKFHHRLAWVAGIAALAWGLSGFGHPIMVWLSPRPVAFSAPQDAIDLNAALAPGAIMARAGVEEAVEIRAVQHDGETLYLLREGEKTPRRYFNVQTGEERPGVDRKRAEHLARYYTGFEDTPILRADYLTVFTDDYPDINRLLPIWRVRFDRDDARTVYVDTGSGQLATIDSKSRSIMRAIFVNVHTLDYLPKNATWAHVLIVTIMVGSVWLTAALGIALLTTLKARKKQETPRKWHRTIGYAAMIPALMFTSSGLYHMFHDVSRNAPAFGNVQPMPIAASDVMLTPRRYLKGDERLAGMNAVRGAGGVPLIRYALAQGAANGGGEHAHHQTNIDHMKRMENKPKALALWFHADSAQPVEGGAETVALSLAQEHLNIGAEDVLSIHPITRFSSEYGFLNKRLPVWRLAIDSDDDRRVFVDAAGGVIASEINAADMRELWVFDNLHKWEFMSFLGRIPRDIISMIAVGLVITMTAFGWVLQIRKVRQTRKRNPRYIPAE